MIDPELSLVRQHQELVLVFDLKANKNLCKEFIIKKNWCFCCGMQSSCVCFSEQEVGRAGKQTSMSLFMGLVISEMLGFTS